VSLLTVIPSDMQVIGAITAQSITTPLLNFSLTGLVGTIGVANGGTGQTTLPAHGVLLGNGVGAVGSAPIGNSGAVFIDQGAADPAFKTLSGDATIVSNGLVTIPGLFGTVQGLRLSFVSSASVKVDIGQARDTFNSKIITLNLPGTITVGTVGAINGNDAKTLTGTVATNNTNTTITGTGTSFLSAFGTRTCAGTIAGAATTITGTNTLFLSQFAVGDMIGTNAKGYSRITAIASNTSLTIAAAIPGGDPTGTTPLCIENVWFQAASQTVQRINTITSDTVLNLPANSSATQSGVGAQIGVLPASQSYLMVWLATGNSGTGVYVSTQRTTSYGISGYTSGARRIGALLYTGTAVMGFDQYGTANERWYQIEESSADIAAILVLNAAANTGWTSVDCSGLLPPTAVAADLCAILATGAVAGFNVFFRARNRGSSTTSRSTQAALNTLSSGIRTMVRTALDGVQQYDYVTSNTSAGNSLTNVVAGWCESL
jgi:hypothetical protein